MITLAFDNQRLFNLVMQRTVYYSAQLDRSVDKADLIPMTEDDKSLFRTMLREAANAVWEKIATWAAADEDNVFMLDYDGDEASTSSYLDNLVYKLDEPTGYSGKVQNAMLTNSIEQAIVYHITGEWLRMKGFDASWQIEWAKSEKALDKVKSAMMYTSTATLKYRTF